jgi:hypothetical protein
MGPVLLKSLNWALKGVALLALFLTFFTGKLTFADDPSVALVACVRHVSCPEWPAHAEGGGLVRLTALSESLPFETAYDVIRRHPLLSVALMLLAFVAAPLATRAMRRGIGEQPGGARKYGT